MRPLAILAALSVATCTAGKGPEPGLENGSFTAELSGRTVHYEVHGTGPVLMTVPNSWGLTLEGLRAMYRPLEAHATMVYFDPRGMGESGPVREDSDLGPDAVREDFEALRKHLGIEKVNAIGWSNGAANLIALAAENPDVIETAVFLHGNASFLPEDQNGIVERYPELMESFMKFGKEMSESTGSAGEKNARVKAFDTELWFPYLFADRDAAGPKLAEIFRDAEFSWAHAEYTNKVWANLDQRPRLGSIRARSLVIAGRHDMLPPERGQEIADGIEGAEFVIFEESGHFAPVEEKEKFVRTVAEFLGAKEARP
ncbi:MAG TPA: alpha/beta hydrolase [Vicinamibacteria bacterium]|nr:alpha/beta hydrolase [Vicinamibacteria bacterium]